MPAKTKNGYEALPAHDELDEDRDDNGGYMVASQSVPELPRASASATEVLEQRGTGIRYTARPGGPIHQRTLSGHGERIVNSLNIDIRNLDARLKEWTSNVTRRFQHIRNKPTRDTSVPYQIVASAFGPVEPNKNPARHVMPKTLDHNSPIQDSDVQAIVEQVKAAIRLGVHPRLNRAGTSGSYFAKSTEGKTRAIFKPKNEEPYGSLNPKWSKWFHRHLLAPFFGFGRACLLPNFSYLSEAGASLLSERLALYIVPHTSLQSLSSPSFFYDWLDRHAYKQKKRPLPDKIGSFQLFLDGYKDASEFLKAHPWPGRATRDTLDLEGNPTGRKRRRGNWTRKFRLLCGAAGVDDDSDDEDDGYEDTPIGSRTPEPASAFVWTRELMQDFQLELEKLVILDVLMRNTDRGLDNFMIKICRGECLSRVPSTATLDKDSESVKRAQPEARKGLALDADGRMNDGPYEQRPHVHVAAIDNSLSFPIHHPNSWRSYCYGWLFLPSSLIGQPFSSKTREHFLPLLTDPEWWARTVFDLRKLFSIDPDFSERMFRKQIALLKGQAWNIVMSLRNPAEGPLELCRRQARIVHDDEVIMADDEFTQEMIEAARLPIKRTPVRPTAVRNHTENISTSPRRTPKPTPTRHTSELHVTRISGMPAYTTRLSPRPLPVSKQLDLNRSTFGNATGVSLMAHMERIQQQEEDAAKSLGVNLPTDLDNDDSDGGDVNETDEQTPLPARIDYGLSTSADKRNQRQGVSLDFNRRASAPHVHVETRLRSGSIDAPSASRRSGEASTGTKIVIVERMEEVDARPYFVRC